MKIYHLEIWLKWSSSLLNVVVQFFLRPSPNCWVSIANISSLPCFVLTEWVQTSLKLLIFESLSAQLCLSFSQNSQLRRVLSEIWKHHSTSVSVECCQFVWVKWESKVIRHLTSEHFIHILVMMLSSFHFIIKSCAFWNQGK